jgi:hypothetical protein
MTTIIETLAGSSAEPGAARNLLVQAGAQFVAEALRDNPDGPVQTITTIGRVEICYEVVIGDSSDGDHGRARTIWHRTVTFGHTDRTVAGGAAFVETARLQDAVAGAALVLVEIGSTPR